VAKGRSFEETVLTFLRDKVRFERVDEECGGGGDFNLRIRRRQRTASSQSSSARRGFGGGEGRPNRPEKEEEIGTLSR